MARRVIPLTVAIATLAVAALTGCSPDEPVPEDTPLFSSEAEAFAAAEATYRAYVDAVNAQRVDPAATPRPDEFLIGNALEVEIEATAQLAQEGWSILGESSVASVTPVAVDEELSTVQLTVCLDSADTVLVDASGQDITPQSRAPRMELALKLVPSNTGLVISESVATGSDTC